MLRDAKYVTRCDICHIPSLALLVATSAAGLPFSFWSGLIPNRDLWQQCAYLWLDKWLFFFSYLQPSTIMSRLNKRLCTTSFPESSSHSPGPSEASTVTASSQCVSQASASQNESHTSFVNPAAIRWGRAEEKFTGKPPEDVLSTSNHSAIMFAADCDSELQKKSWRSSVYNHFHLPEIIELNGDIYYRFVCKRWVSCNYL